MSEPSEARPSERTNVSELSRLQGQAEAKRSEARPSELDVVAIRRALHAHPELGFAEKRTTQLIMDQLRALGLSPGGAAVGDGRRSCDSAAAPGPLIALRADIDALPIADQKDVPYRSTIEGMCHGCGHDAHTAILLGAAAQLCRRRIARTGAAGVPARRGDGARRLDVGHRTPACSTASSRSTRCTVTRAGHRPDRPARRADHRGVRPDRDRVLRTRRPHRPSAPDGRPRLRRRPGDHRAARPAVAPGRPACRRVDGVGLGRRRPGGQRDPDERPAARHAARA